MNQKEIEIVFDTLEGAFKHLNIDYYLIGAMARQHWFGEGDLQYRTTKDIDYAVYIGSREEYQKARDYLIENNGYIETKTNAFVLITPNNIQIDILPFGEIQKDGNVTIDGVGLTSINMEGMKEVYDAGIKNVQIYPGKFFKVATLPAIVLLKLIAYDDRPEHRQKDSMDIGNIIMNFFNLNDNLIYDCHSDLFEEDQTLENIGAIVIGREMAVILKGNTQLKKKINTILHKHKELSENSAFNRIMASEIHNDIESIIGFLNKMLWGLNNPANAENI